MSEGDSDASADCCERRLGGMSITVEELAARLNAEAARRGITVDALIDELTERVVEPEVKPVKRRLAFVGIGASTSGRGARDADEMLAEGFGQP